MSFYSTHNIHIKGISTCVPERILMVKDIPLFSEKDADTFSKNTGIVQKHVATPDICASDLCYKAAESIIDKLGWQKDEIDILLFVSQTPDFILPATSNLLQNRLQLSKDCFCLDISLGCSAYIYGLSTISNLLQNKSFKKGLLLVGDTITNFSSEYDKSVFPLFGDAGTATAIERDENLTSTWSFITGSDGSGEESIKINDGGARNKVNENSLVYQPIPNDPEGKKRPIDLYLNGVDIFNFAIKLVPKLIVELLEKVNKTTDDIDYVFLHQANLFMNETIRKRLKLDKEKTPNSIANFGNTNGSSIPVTICDFFHDDVIPPHTEMVLCGFGVGLSWGAVHISNQSAIQTQLVYL